MLKEIRFLLKKYFYFTTKESNGFIILCSILFILLFVLILFRNSNADFSVYEKNRLDSLVTILKKSCEPKITKFSDSSGYVSEHEKIIVMKEKNLTLFDPNKDDSLTLLKAGIANYLIPRIIKYRTKGGKFKVKKDLLKIYGLSDKTYQFLKERVQLPDTLSKTIFSKIPQVKDSIKIKQYDKNLPKIIEKKDINLSMLDDLISVNGIGEKTAGRILELRQKLGGFIYLDQLKSVYTKDSLFFEKIEMNFFIASDFIPQKININKITVEEWKHPYLSFKEVRLIIAYREQHGNFTKPEDLLKIYTLSPERLEKILIYLEF